MPQEGPRVAPVAPAHLLLLFGVGQRAPQVPGHQLLDHVQVAGPQEGAQEEHH